MRFIIIFLLFQGEDVKYHLPTPGCLAVKDIAAVIAKLESGVHAFWEENGFFFP